MVGDGGPVGIQSPRQFLRGVPVSRRLETWAADCLLANSMRTAVVPAHRLYGCSGPFRPC